MQESNKSFIKTLSLLSLPIILQDFIGNSVVFMDIWMVGRLAADSVDYINAVGLSNRLFFLCILLIFGFSSGGSIFMGQFWGKGEVSGIHKVMGLVLVFNLMAAGAFASIALFAPGWFLGFLTYNENVIAQGSAYLRVMSISYFLSAVSTTISTTLRSIRQTKVPMASSMVSFCCKLLCNILFIFVFEWGVVGAAWATVAMRTIEIIAQIFIIKWRNLPILAKPTAYFNWRGKDFLRSYFRISVPVILNESVWAFGIFFYDIAYRFAGNDAQGAVQISTNLEGLFMVAGMGFGIGSSIIISNLLGEGKRKEAIVYSRKCLKTGAVIATTMALILLIASPFILSTYEISDEVRRLARNNLFVVSAGMTVKTINFYNIVGILRRGGDTMFCLLLDTGSVWMIGVPLAFLGAMVLGLPIYWVLVMVYFEEVVKIFFSLRRVLSNRWAQRLV